MKKLFIRLSILILLLGCVGLQTKDEIYIEGWIEIEGEQLYKWDEITDFSLKEIEKWVVQNRSSHQAEEMAGAAPGYQYEMVVYEIPDLNGMGFYVLTYVLVGDQRRVETVGFVMVPYGVMTVADRYHNTDQWYWWSMAAYMQQHPEGPDPDRFKRNNSL
ncbi:MAG TPA: hypothetical protein ENI07_10020 [Desulfobacterales bacterium]|nr:hypothetical protein [Desulfobacterales bacterium]